MGEQDASGAAACRYFLTCTGLTSMGVKVPFSLIGPVDARALSGRNTFVRAYYDAEDRLVRFEKVVYGDVELSHRYAYNRDGSLAEAEVALFDMEPIRLCLDNRYQDNTGAARP